MGIGLSVIFWAGGYFLEMLVSGLPQKLFWANLKQIGSVLLPFSFLLFTAQYTHIIKKIPKFLVFILSIEPLIILFNYWTDAKLRLMRIDPHLIKFGSLTQLEFDIGPGLQIHFIYSALVSLTAVTFLLSRLFRAKSFYRNQIAFILLGMSIPFLGAMAVFLGVVPAKFDTTPIFLGLSFPIMTWGLVRNEFFTIAPFDSQMIMEHIPFGVLVVDKRNELKIISANPVIEELFDEDLAEILGSPLKKYMPELDFERTNFVNQFVFEQNFSDRFFEIHCEQISGETAQQDLWLMIFIDLTIQRKLEESLITSEAMYRSLIENSIEGIAISQENKIIFLNQQMAAMLKYPPDELIGKPYQKLISEDLMEIQKKREEQRAHGEILNPFLQGAFYTKDNNKVDVELSSVQIDYLGKPAFLIMVRDVTNRKKIEEERNQSLALLEATIESSNNGILVIDLDDQVLTHNQRFLEIWDLPQDWQKLDKTERYQLLSQKMTSPEYSCKLLSEIKNAIHEQFTEKLRMTNGKIIEVYTTPFYIKTRLIGRMFVFHDITERMKNENRLIASEEKYRLLAENASDVIWLMDLEGNYTYISPSVFSLLGETADELMQALNESDHNLQTWTKVEHLRNAFNETIKTKTTPGDFSDRFYLEQKHKNGSTVWTEVKISLIYENEKITGIQGVTRDITERKAYEQEIEYARQLAEKRSDELQAALDREQKLHKITRTISRTMEIDTVLSELLRQTIELTGAEEAHLGLISEDGQTIQFQYAMNQQQSFTINQLVPRGNYLSWHVVDQRQGLLINGLDQLKQMGLHSITADKAIFSSFIVVPLMAGLNVLGVMGVYGKPGSKFFTEHDLFAVEAIGTHAGIALQNARMFEEMNMLAITDPLTRLFNRRYFFNLARVELERAKRYEQHLSIIMVDIDDFKRVNDSYGHLVGDDVLIAVAETIRRTVRSVDLCARYGGEEMIILMPTTDLPAAMTSAERLRKEVEHLSVPINGKSISVTISLGVSSLQEGSAVSISKLLDQADQAMYQSKQKGKNQVNTWQGNETDNS